MGCNCEPVRRLRGSVTWRVAYATCRKGWLLLATAAAPAARCIASALTHDILAFRLPRLAVRSGSGCAEIGACTSCEASGCLHALVCRPRPEKVKQSVTMVSFQHCICNNARHSFVLENEPEHFHVVSWRERASDHVEKSCWVGSTRGGEVREEGQGLLRSIPLNCLSVCLSVHLSIHPSIHPSSRYSYLGSSLGERFS
jgi:hypothetical protein